MTQHDDGQATVELALSLPILAMFILAIVQVGVVVRDQLAVIHAAREGARAAAIDNTASPMSAARRGVERTSGLDATRRRVATTVSDGLVTVVVTYRSPTDVPVIGTFLPDRTLTATVVMALEPSS